MRTYYKPFDDSPAAGSASLYQHEIPGGQYTNLKQQASAMGLRNRWPEVERMYARVNQLFGDIVKVTPSSKVVGDMALFLIVKGMTPEDVLRLPEDPTWRSLTRSSICLRDHSGRRPAAGRRRCKGFCCEADPRLPTARERACRRPTLTPPNGN